MFPFFFRFFPTFQPESFGLEKTKNGFYANDNGFEQCYYCCSLVATVNSLRTCTWVFSNIFLH